MGCHFSSLLRDFDTNVSKYAYLNHNNFNLNPSPVVVDYGSIRLNGGTVVNVTRIIKHEDVNWVTGDSDIALLKTDPMKLDSIHAQKIGLPQQDFGLGVGRIVNISGFGWTDNYGPYSKNLKYGSAKVLSEKECKEGFPQLTEKQFCAGDFGLGTTDFCYGDYGGPAANWGILYGIQSTHKNRYWCGLPKQPGVYTNVSQFVDWIKKTITNNSDNNELRKLTSFN
ncbi:hypothetical protein RDWZM_001934 [Blomia tropicalis]|uniref:Peptidase S1 domain-containing protein n=1 Tax=Blomia tropicalis TaxID=40697 RepID=A0A9Q0RR19_BLOTA|nr:hypothetical protein RDWZM_001934 [Blomia tropicalis]